MDLGDTCHTVAMQDALVVKQIRGKFAALGPVMDERMRRQWAASEALALKWGGVSNCGNGNWDVS